MPNRSDPKFTATYSDVIIAFGSRLLVSGAFFNWTTPARCKSFMYPRTPEHCQPLEVALQANQSFWRRWSCEYLCSLQARTKWTNNVPNLKEGDMVVIKDNQSPPTAWRLGRVLNVMPGADGVVRVARMMTAQGELTRPVVKLVLLPTE